jgi:hypothetical protein
MLWVICPDFEIPVAFFSISFRIQMTSKLEKRFFLRFGEIQRKTKFEGG